MCRACFKEAEGVEATSGNQELVRLMHDLANVQVQLCELLDAHRRETKESITAAQQIAAELRRAAEALAAQGSGSAGRDAKQGEEGGKAGGGSGGGEASSQGSSAPQGRRERVRPVKVGRRSGEQGQDAAQVQALLVELAAVLSQAEHVLSRLKSKLPGET